MDSMMHVGYYAPRCFLTSLHYGPDEFAELGFLIALS